MKRKVEASIESIAEIIFQWPAVDCITVMKNELDLYDPYFFMSLDVYSSGNIPDADERQRTFNFSGGFESDAIRVKDRFMMGDIAFRVEYKSKERVDGLLSGDGTYAFREGGSYTLYRLKEAQIVRHRTPWINEIRAKLDSLPDRFWQTFRAVHQSRMEHYLNDMSAAVLREDGLFYHLSLSGLISSLCGTLFAANKRFEPSPRSLHREVFLLPLLPDALRGSIENLLKGNSDSRQRQREVAEYIVRRVIAL